MDRRSFGALMRAMAGPLPLPRRWAPVLGAMLLVGPGLALAEPEPSAGCPDLTFTRPTQGEVYPVVGRRVSGFTFEAHMCSVYSAVIYWLDGQGNILGGVGVGTDCSDLDFEFAFATRQQLTVSTNHRLRADTTFCDGSQRVDQVQFTVVLATIPV
jgi:hypothetical protein